MKKQFLLPITMLMLSACSSPQQAPQAPLDLNAVENYKAKVYSGNTVPANQRKVIHEVEQPLNASDSTPKINTQPRMVIVPSIGYGYHRHIW